MGKKYSIGLIVSICLGSTFGNKLKCQELELAGVRYLHYPNSNNNASHGNYTANEFGVFFNYPKKLKNGKTFVINGAGYGFVNIKTENGKGLNPAQNIRLHNLAYNFSLIHKYSESILLMGSLVPTFSSDFKGKFSSDDFVLQSMVMGVKKFNPKFKFGIGLSYTTRLGQPLVVPVVPWYYKSKKHKISSILPIKFVYTYQAIPKVEIGFKALVNGGNFNVSEVYNQSLEINRAHYTRANLGPIIYYKPQKMVSLEITGGISTGRRFRLEDTYGNQHFNTSTTEAFFNIGLIIKPPMEN